MSTPSDNVASQNTQPLVIFARLLAKSGEEEAMRAELLKMIEPTRAEPGCLFYDLHQCADQPAVFFFHESWSDRNALKRHMGMPHMQTMDKALEDLQVEHYSVVLTHMVSTPANG